jgi:hypothetical protein
MKDLRKKGKQKGKQEVKKRGKCLCGKEHIHGEKANREAYKRKVNENNPDIVTKVQQEGEAMDKLIDEFFPTQYSL